MRVTHIGQEIAKGEGFEEEVLVIGCLLHDLMSAPLITKTIG